MRSKFEVSAVFVLSKDNRAWLETRKPVEKCSYRSDVSLSFVLRRTFEKQLMQKSRIDKLTTKQLNHSKGDHECPAEEKEKEEKWQRINAKKDYAATAIKRKIVNLT